jgi:adenosylcobinamide-GDP ribazoletransferase
MQVASVRAAAAAVTFLTRVPIGRAIAIDGTDIARGALAFPLVGAGVGAASGGFGVLLHHWLSPFVAAAIAVACGVLLTGGMHVDALADTFDAFAARTRERALEIMRDSRVGAYGVSAIVLDVLIRVGAVATLLDRGKALAALVAAGALSRAASPPLATVLAYPRADPGPGSVLTGRVSRLTAVSVVALGVGLALLAAGVTGLELTAAVAVPVLCLALVFHRWLGGATGDCLGAATEISETIALVVAAALA